MELWRTSDFTLIRTLKGHVGSVTGVDFSRDGNVLASSSLDHTVKLWDVSQASVSVASQFPCSTPSTGTAWRMALLPNQRCVAQTRGNIIELINLETAETRDVRFPEEGAVEHRNFGPGTCGRWHRGRSTVSLVGGKPCNTAGIKLSQSQISALAYDPGSMVLAMGDVDGAITLRRVDTGDPILEFGRCMARICSLAFQADGMKMVSACWNGKVAVWDVVNHRQDFEVDVGYGCGVLNAALSPNGRVLAVASQYSACYCGTCPRRTESLLSSMRRPQVSRSQRMDERCSPAAQSGDYTVKIWDVASHEQRLALAGHTSIIGDVFLTRDESMLVTCEWEGNVRVWRARGEPP